MIENQKQRIEFRALINKESKMLIDRLKEKIEQLEKSSNVEYVQHRVLAKSLWHNPNKLYEISRDRTREPSHIYRYIFSKMVKKLFLYVVLL